MDVAMIGAGNVGSALASSLTKAGHSVTITATSRQEAERVAQETGAHVRAEVAELRSRGVAVEEYDMPGLKTEDGVADIGFAWGAWITDPGRNVLGILQIKE